MVSTTSVVESGSISVPVSIVPERGVPSEVLPVSPEITGGSFTGKTVMVSVSLTQSAGSGIPLSQILITIISVPLKLRFGV